MKVIDFTTRKVIAQEPRQSGPTSSVPVITLNKGKFTLAVENCDGDRFLVIYNTASKAEIARRPAHHNDRNKWISWAVDVVDSWQ